MIRRFFPVFLLLAVAAFIAPSGVTPSMAQEAAIADNLKPLVDQASKDGSTVIIISPKREEAATVKAAEAESMTESGLRLRNEIRRLIVTSPEIFTRMYWALEIASPDGSMFWLLRAIGTAIVGLVLGFFASRQSIKWTRSAFGGKFLSEPQDNADRIGLLVFRSFISIMNIAVLFVVAFLFAVIFDFGHEPSRRTIIVILFGYAAWRAVRFTFVQNLFAPDLPKHRMINMSDADANAITNDFRWITAIAAIAISTSAWLVSLDLDGDANKLLQIFSPFIAAGSAAYITIRHRQAIAGVILGPGNPDTKWLPVRMFAASWHLIMLAYLVVATGASVVRLLLGLPSANILISAPAGALFGAIGAYAVMFLVIEWYFRQRRAAFDRRLRNQIHREIEQRKIEEAARKEAERLATETSGVEAVEEIVHVADESAKALPRFVPIFKPLLQQAAGLLVTLAAIGFVLELWEIRTSDGRSLVAAFMNTLAIAFIAWILYRAVAIYADAKLAEEGGHADPTAMVDMEESSGEHGSSRLGTLLPLLRNVLMSMIVAVAGMIILSNLGVDVAPLFAGAGVVGLAVGFGAQTLIRDIFSGGFFLFDDAFRKGEYIELGNIRGTVEKISLRSFQLRHHNGPLHTIPFGEITQLTNYSRDWVIMKLPLRLTFDADIEKVRKLVKKLGQQLLSHPDVGKSFLQPLKSQGVVEIDDSSLIVRVKFMTKPGDQWVTRKVVYAAIQEMFRAEGIRFANKQVTVRIADEDEDMPQSTKRQAAAAAAEAVIAAAAVPQPVKDDR